MTKQKLVFNIPGPDEPGHFKRAIEIQAAFDAIKADGGMEELKHLISLLAKYIDGPTDEVQNLLLDASKNQIRDMVNAILGGGGKSPFPIETD